MTATTTIIILHDHDHSELSEDRLRVRALEDILTREGYVDPAALDLLIETYETKVGRATAPRAVARAWADAGYRARLLKDATPAISELGYAGRQGEHIVRWKHPALHNMVVCTAVFLLSLAGARLPPVWYKSAPIVSKAVKDPRGVLADFGFELAPKRYRDSRLGFDSGNSLSGASAAPPRYRRLGAKSASQTSSPATA